jgi:lipopolysaccharide export system permease protein
MKLIDKYLFNQIAVTTIFAIFIVTIIWISPEILFKIIKRTVNGEISVLIAMKLLIYNIPDILGKVIPAGLLLGTLFVFDRLSKDSELVIFRCAGASLYRLAIPVLVLGILGTVISFVTLDKLIPVSSTAIKEIKNGTSQNYFVYVDKSNDGKPKNILIIGKYDGNNSTNIKYLMFEDKIKSDVPILSSIITADNAKWFNDHLQISNGTEYKIAPDGVYRDIIKFKDKNVLLGETAAKAHKLLVNSTKKSAEMNIKELNIHLKLLKSMGIDDEYRYFLSKLYQRYSQPFSCILFAVCGIILGYNKPREKLFIGLTIAVATVFMYYIIGPFLDMLAQSAILSPMLSAWLPNLIVAGLIAVMLKIKQI